MSKTFSVIFLVSLFTISGFVSVVFAHGGEADGHGGSMMKMDNMMDEIMKGSSVIDCAKMDSAGLIDKGEDLMSEMMGGDKVKHEAMEEAMEKTAGVEFHDMMHIMMGRTASGCLTDQQQKVVASKLTAVAPQRTSQTLPLVIGIVIGLAIGLIGMSFFRSRGETANPSESIK